MAEVVEEVEEVEGVEVVEAEGEAVGADVVGARNRTPGFIELAASKRSSLPCYRPYHLYIHESSSQPSRMICIATTTLLVSITYSPAAESHRQ